MEVILIKEMPNLGNPGDIVQVKNGYARNYLFPQKKAVLKSKVSLEILKKQKKEFQKQIIKQKEKHTQIIDGFKKIDCLDIQVKVRGEGKIYGTVTTQMISKELKEKHKINLEKKNIIISTPLKALGDYSVLIQLNKDFKTQLKIKLSKLET